MNAGYLMNDISDYQAGFDANKYARTGRKAIMIKAVEGTSWAAGGVNHRQRALAAHAAGLKVVHYAFIRPMPGTSQAIMLLSTVKTCWEDGDVLCADVEDQTLHEQAAAKIVGDWCATLKAHGHEHPIGYSGRAYLEERPKLVTSGTIKGWITADYGTLRGASPIDKAACRPRPCFGRQFTDGEIGPQPHTCGGITGPVDCTMLTQEGFEWICEHK